MIVGSVPYPEPNGLVCRLCICITAINDQARRDAFYNFLWRLVTIRHL